MNGQPCNNCSHVNSQSLECLFNIVHCHNLGCNQENNTNRGVPIQSFNMTHMSHYYESLPDENVDKLHDCLVDATEK